MLKKVNWGRMIVTWACTGFVLFVTKTPVNSWVAAACLMSIWSAIVCVSENMPRKNTNE